MTPEEEVNKKYEHAEEIGRVIGSLEYLASGEDRNTVIQELDSAWTEWIELAGQTEHSSTAPQLEAFLQLGRYEEIRNRISKNGPIPSTLEAEAVPPSSIQTRELTWSAEGGVESIRSSSNALSILISDLVLQKLEEQQKGRDDIRNMAHEVGRDVIRALGLPRNV